MKIENFNGLKEQVKFTGFDVDRIAEQLEAKMKSGEKVFTINLDKQFGRDQASAVLHFKKSKEGDNYFFNSYDMSVKFGHQEHALKQTFYINNLSSKERVVAEGMSPDGEKKRNPNITLKEAYNLLSGRSVYKSLHKVQSTEIEGKKFYHPVAERYEAWLKMDFSKVEEKTGNYQMNQYGKGYQFDHKALIASLNLKENQSPESLKELIESLERGNRQMVTFVHGDGREQKGYLEITARFKNVNIYDEQHQRKRSVQELLPELKPEAKQSKKEVKKEAGAEEEVGKKTKKARATRKMSF